MTIHERWLIRKLDPGYSLALLNESLLLIEGTSRAIALKRMGSSNKSPIHGIATDAPAIRCAAPGRVNLIGEHTDYSGGFVMPAAIDFRTIATIRPRTDDLISLFSENLSEHISYPAEPLPSTRKRHWSDYPMGVAWSLSKEGVRAGAFDLSLVGNVPLGSGLSSSASIEVATALSILELAGATLPLATIALACQRAENGFVGAQSGIMDQFIACAGKQDHALMLDCRSLEYRLLPIPAHVRLIICNSMVKHEHAGGQYNVRREEVEEGTRILHDRWPSIVALRDCSVAQLEDARQQMPENVFRRCRHIVTENKRVELAASALERADLAAFGGLMAEAHISFRDDFEASCEEIDALVQMASQLPGCYGSRITGGGFGGCTINLVDERNAEEFRRVIRDQYKATHGIDADIYSCKASDGATRLS